MPNATHAQSYSAAVEIGQKIKDRADDRNLTGVEEYILQRITRAQNPIIRKVALLHEPDDHETKFVIVPHKDIIDQTIPGPGIPAAYDYRPEELPVAAEAVIRRVDPSNTMSSEQLGDAIKQLASRLPSSEEFFFFKMGEYCVTQCQ
ncbi:MAG: hypothetical protein ABJ327_05205 [Litoreibacter sp.]